MEVGGQGAEGQAGLTSPSDAAGAGPRTHENVSISFKIRRQKKNECLLRRKCFNI